MRIETLKSLCYAKENIFLNQKNNKIMLTSKSKSFLQKAHVKTFTGTEMHKINSQISRTMKKARRESIEQEHLSKLELRRVIIR